MSHFNSIIYENILDASGQTCSGYSLEASQLGASNEHPQLFIYDESHMILWRTDKK